MTVLGEPLGNLGESTARNRPCGKWPGKIKFLFRECFVFSRKWPVGTSILLESGIVLEFSTAKTLESGIVLTPKRLRVVSFLNLGYQFRLRNASFLSFKKQKRLRVASFLRFWAPDCRIRGIPHDDDDSPGYPHPPTPSRPGKKYVVRPGSSLRLVTGPKAI